MIGTKFFLYIIHFSDHKYLVYANNYTDNDGGRLISNGECLFSSGIEFILANNLSSRCSIIGAVGGV